MKKGQAAMEFLMTYGWAILVVLVAIAALAYFGVLSPGRFLPESCNVGPGIGCTEGGFKIVADGSAIVTLQNGIGSDLSAVTLSLNGVNSANGTVATFADGSTYSFTWATGALATGTAGTKYSAPLVLSYSQGGVTHSKTGKLTTRYE